MSNKPLVRIIIDIVIIISLLHGWWFVVLPLGIIGVFSFPVFIEFILAGIVYDALFGLAPGQGVTGYLGMIVAAGVTVVIAILKKIIR